MSGYKTEFYRLKLTDNKDKLSMLDLNDFADALAQLLQKFRP
jgi:hypothetical protein